MLKERGANSYTLYRGEFLPERGAVAAKLSGASLVFPDGYGHAPLILSPCCPRLLHDCGHYPRSQRRPRLQARSKVPLNTSQCRLLSSKTAKCPLIPRNIAYCQAKSAVQMSTSEDVAVRPENLKLFIHLTFFDFLLMLDQQTPPFSDTPW
jgi:hypothetical protein